MSTALQAKSIRFSIVTDKGPFGYSGDSYSSVEDYRKNPPPTHSNPLGVPYPGQTWAEPGKPNWVGHLITEHCPHPKFKPSSDKQDEEYLASGLLVHDYAVGGDRVNGVQHQIQDRFLPAVGKRPDWAAWNSNDTLFVTWVGINDCAWSTDPSGPQTLLVSLQEKLYAAGARNFLFIDVPPIHRSPAVPAGGDRSQPYLKWNAGLLSSIQTFSSSHPDVTTLLFSSYATFSYILDSPGAHGFDPTKVKRPGGDIWMDHLHPTSKVHNIVAKDIADFLATIESSGAGSS